MAVREAALPSNVHIAEFVWGFQLKEICPHLPWSKLRNPLQGDLMCVCVCMCVCLCVYLAWRTSLGSQRREVWRRGIPVSPGCSPLYWQTERTPATQSTETHAVIQGSERDLLSWSSQPKHTTWGSAGERLRTEVIFHPDWQLLNSRRQQHPPPPPSLTVIGLGFLFSGNRVMVS